MTIVATIDVETTGLGHKSPGGARPDGIVQVGLAWRKPNGEVEVWERNCNPGRHFLAGGRADEALSISKLSVKTVLSSPSSAATARALRKKLSDIRRTDQEVIVRVFNLEFDRPFLEASPWKLEVAWGACLMVEAARRFGAPNDRIPLWRACQEAGIPVSGRLHSAGTDAKMALLLHEVLASPVRPKATVKPVRYHPGCELDHPHDGPCGYFAEGDFYEFE